jgi:hypothetical protein
MNEERFDSIVRLLSGGATRRGIFAAVAGLAGLHAADVSAERRVRTKRRAAERRKRRRRVTTQRQRVAAPQRITIATGCPRYPADSIGILHAFYPGYWWDQTELTVAIQAHPNADPQLIAAARKAIELWNVALRSDAALRAAGVRLIDVTDTLKPPHKANIVLHFVPRAGGTNFAGYAICGAQKCNNVIISSDAPKPLDIDHASPQDFAWLTIHELGHALGLGHAEPLLETNDIMGYNWPDPAPVLSECDLRGLRYVFAWAIEKVEPYPPTAPSIDCSDLCRRSR